MRAEDGGWPELDLAADPWRVAWPDDDLGYDDLVNTTWAPRIPAEAYPEAALALQAHLDALRAGLPLDPARLVRLADAAGVSTVWRNDRRPARVGPWRASEAMIARLSLDFEPAAGLFGPDAMLGPWAAIADPPTLALAVAHWAGAETSERPPHRAHRSARPIPPVDERAAVRAVAWAPLSLWRMSRSTDGWRMEDRVGLHWGVVPEGPVTVGIVGGFGPLVDGAAVLARAVRTVEGWSAWGPLVLPAEPPADAVHAWIVVELVSLRLRRRRATVEDVLRERCHHVSRAMFQWAYGAAPGPQLG